MELNTAFLNNFGPPFFIIIHLSTGVYGIFLAMPKLYDSQNLLLFMQVVACLGIIQLKIFWYITKVVDSSYNPIHASSIPKLAKEIEARNGHSSRESQGHCKKAEHKVHKGNSISNSLLSGQYKDDTRLSHTYHDALSFKINVATSNVNGIIKKKPFPYWSWIPCSKCQIVRPPRCHHCPLCEKCILKRDHHCFFTGTCIGVKNQGHFIVFTFWAVFVTLFGTIHMIPYTYLEILPTISYFDLIPPLCIARVLLGYTPMYIPGILILFWSLLLLTVLSIITFYEILNTTIRGSTSFEIENKIKVTDCRSVSDRWCDALGTNWPLSFVIPRKVLNEKTEDAFLWPHIKL